MANLKLENIEKVYDGKVKAVSDFNLEIKEKEFIILVGPSGCGKTTVLRMIAGLEDITSGNLYIDGEKVNNMEPKDRDIAMVFQNYALYPHMSVYDNMAFGLKMRKTPKEEIKKSVMDSAETLGIEELLDRKPKALSGGQRQRVALGRAIVRKPKVFLMDEPLSNLDAKLRVQMRAEIVKLHKRLGTTFVYVTHDQTEAMTMGDRIVVMKAGFIQQVATPTELYDDPINTFVASFIGSPQMNFIDADIIEKDNKIYLKIEDEIFELPKDSSKILRNKGYINETLIVGIRPEDTIITKDSPSLTGEIDGIENTGSEKFLYFTVADREVVSKYSCKDECDIGDNMNISFNTDKFHYFDKKTKERIIM